MMKLNAFLLLLLLGISLVSTYQNVALRGKSTQSTRLTDNPVSAAHNAIDGNRNSEFSVGSCTHTNEQTNPWWRVDLLQSYIITSVTIFNRGDCCQHRLSGLEIHIGNSLNNEGLENPKVGTISEGRTGESKLTFTNRVEGRYVTLTLPGSNRILTLCEVEVYGYPAPTDENLALQGKATQSSRYSFGIAYNAIDGNRNSKWEEASCTLTKKSMSPWWRLDLLKTHKVFSVRIVNQDSHPERLNGAEIRIGESLENDGNNNPRCAVITGIAGGAVADFKCNGTEGRYINIVIPKRNEFLSLCEVEVYGSRLDYPRGNSICFVRIFRMMKRSVFILLLLLRTTLASTYQNLATRGKATQSTCYPHARASALNAIDGNRNSDFMAGSCTHTNEQTNPWWKVDLLQSYVITSITVTNRGDCCHERLNGLEIHTGNSLVNDGLDNPMVGRISRIRLGKSFDLTFTNRVEGQYVTLTLPGSRRILTLCEVEVYGYPAPTEENLALQGKATQSSLYAFGNAFNAIDGNRNSKWEDASCTLTRKSMSPWWRLDLLKTHKVFSINIVNQDSLPERLNGAEIRIGDSLHNNGNNNSRCAVITSIAGDVVAKFTCNGTEGRYVNIVIPNREEFLSLCEVEVYGSRLD
ncbi:uncharacterized protein LOC134636526 [Pelmatolapia mariae]|uniref:uncharacterized protein LOC134636526 n=1 Tax=Pelmatolapia mariae TaxID=158779 RepID=UPI003211D015